MGVNIANLLRATALKNPDKPAVVLCSGPGSGKGAEYSCERYTFKQLDNDSDAAARGFLEEGIGRGVKTLVMLRPSFPFFSCFFALFKVGAVPVFIDPGMGGSRLLECVRVLAPEAMVGLPLAHLARVLCRRSFPGLKVAVTYGRRWLWGGRHWESIRKFKDEPFPIVNTDADELAAILFTTGSTGPAKGVEYSHGALDRQVRILTETFGIGEQDKDLATFPGFSLFSIALGMTAVVPDMNPVRPGSVFPPNIIEPLLGEKCTFSFGSPALWGRVSEYAVKHGKTLPGLKRVVMAGAAVPATVHERLLGKVLDDDANTFTPYGATEVMPVACIGGREVLAETAAGTPEGKGVCVGYPSAGVRVEMIAVDDGPVPEWNEGMALGIGEFGEITIQADHASRHYHNLPEADALAKIRDGEKFWHRMGDIGYKDAAGRIWFCGRKAHRVRAAEGDLFTICCEGVFNVHPAVARTALVGVPAENGFERPVLVAELRKNEEKEGKKIDKETIRRDLLELGKKNPLTAGITNILFSPSFPTDIRHNAKIRREELAEWAARNI